MITGQDLINMHEPGNENHILKYFKDCIKDCEDSDCKELFFDVVRKNALYEVEGEFYQSASDYALTHTNDEILEKINNLK